MDKAMANRLIALNREFYRDQASSFSATRTSPWRGWERCLDASRGGLLPKGASLKVADVGCGNLRFEEFLSTALPEVALRAVALDSCAELVPAECQGSPVVRKAAFAGRSMNLGIFFRECDVIGLLSAGRESEVFPEDEKPFDLAVAFGFLHHVPLASWRRALIRSMASAVRPGGYAWVSFWRFADDPSMKTRAEAAHARGLERLGIEGPALDEGDYLLGWRNEQAAFRYCHSFTTAEVDDLVASLADAADAVSRFRADGRTGDLNEYVVFRVR